MSEPLPPRPLVGCPACGAVIELEHTTIMRGLWPGVPIRHDPIESELDALARHTCPEALR